MGQRSQIFIRHKDNGKPLIIAKYYGWNYGERMVSRARGIMEHLLYFVENEYTWAFAETSYIKKIKALCDVNFDMRDVVIGSDIMCDELEENAQCLFEKNLSELTAEEYAECIFSNHNNDGQLFIDICDDKLKYCFVPYFTELEKIMNAEQYMDWEHSECTDEEYKNWRVGKDYSEYTLDNIAWLNENATLMTVDEMCEFVNCDYRNYIYQ